MYGTNVSGCSVSLDLCFGKKKKMKTLRVRLGRDILAALSANAHLLFFLFFPSTCICTMSRTSALTVSQVSGRTTASTVTRAGHVWTTKALEY